ncbi:TPA: hypothetical protein DIV55_04195 [Patescibacteria group bacterium]|uniref:Uncharacterized protein n=1 Tax=Candidatus Gottesmanbacteria bacterium GW2011_GWA1_43_11 TaxID=1618436 RepID=A0A0G1CGE3_9BACT|nr:MAG: hypothetical protein UV59_C0017G0012 [Candidatus Gottesmanbacteria bacterium GW2011_GWA1_43_11]HCS78915.1 hypothetical protein [Patescibacteria group bacterium]
MSSHESTPLTLAQQNERAANLLNLISHISESNFLMAEFCGMASPVSNSPICMDVGFAVYKEADTKTSLLVVGQCADKLWYHQRNILSLMNNEQARFTAQLHHPQALSEWGHFMEQSSNFGKQLPLCVMVAGTYADNLTAAAKSATYNLFYSPKLTDEVALALVHKGLFNNYRSLNNKLYTYRYDRRQ